MKKWLVLWNNDSNGKINKELVIPAKSRAESIKKGMILLRKTLNKKQFSRIFIVDSFIIELE